MSRRSASPPSSPGAGRPARPRGSRPAGRGAVANPAGRFETRVTQREGDGWEAPDAELTGAEPPGAEPPLRTQTTEERVGRIVTRNASPDLSFDRSVNPYRGCEHGCTYCYARSSHAYLGLSPGLDFETKLTVKPGAAAALRRELSARGYAPATIAIGTNTDPYQPIERDRRVMRACLEVLAEFRHPVAIVTRGALVTRDADLLGEMGRAGLARVGLSIPTLDAALSRSMEPRAPAPAQRLRAAERLAAAGVPVRLCLAPVIPGLTDHEVEAIVAAAARAGATAASLAMLRLPGEVAGLFRAWLEEARPDRAARVMARVREVHGGRDYDATFGRRLTGQGEVARLIRRRFRLACRRHGLAERMPALRTDLFRVPPRPGDQLALF